MRVLIVPKDFPSAHQPRTGIFVLRRMEALAKLGYELAVLRAVPWSPRAARWRRYWDLPEYETIGGFPVHTVRAPIPPRFIGVEYVPLFLQRALAREIAAFKPDVVHASFLIPSGQLVARQQLAPSIVTSHGIDVHTWITHRPGMRRACTEALTKATRVTAVSRFLADRIRALVPREVDVIWNGGDERFFFPRDMREARERLGLPPERKIVAFAGTLMRAKGLFELVDAAAAFESERPILALAGTGPDRGALEQRAQDLGVDVRFFGHLDAAAVGQLFAAADVVTLPSYAEGLPNVVCEAMLAERAVVASTAGGIPEIVEDEKTGLLVPPRSAGALHRALRAALEDGALRARLAAEARRFAQEHLTWDVSARGYDAVYRKALDAAARTPSTNPRRTTRA